MDYVNLGATGMRVSRLCLGMMSYGKHESRPWTLDEDEAEPIVRCAVDGGITFFDTADVYNGGAERGDHRSAATQAVLDARGVRRRDQGQRSHDAGRQRRAACRASTSWPRSTPRWPASSSTTSTCTRSTAGIRTPRSRRRWTRCTTSSRRARRATSAPAACTRGSSRRRRRSRRRGSSRCRTTTT